MKKFWNRIAALMLAGTMALSLAVCGGSPDTGGTQQDTGANEASGSGDNITIRITWWGGESRHGYT